MSRMLKAPPLALYIHIPWCLQKCPYCDFNSHAIGDDLEESAYVAALLLDLDSYLPQVLDRKLISIFIGGGTPSLFSGASIQQLLDGVRARLDCLPDMEVTLEANPGAIDQGHFKAYRQAGVNRLSVGAQSFSSEKLKALGRIHGPDEIVTAVEVARTAGFNNINLDLMYGLPGQTLADAENDLARVIDLKPEHISYYQLTIEPNTQFHLSPPILPDGDRLWDIETMGHEMLEAEGYRQYEISAFASAGFECQHNRNYWEFGDYIGIGAGAHGKLTDIDAGEVYRSKRPRSPDAYLKSAIAADFLSLSEQVNEQDLPLEFMLNALRLKHGFYCDLFEQRTGLPISYIQDMLDLTSQQGLLQLSDGYICPTPRGSQFLNELLAIFMPQE